MRISGSVGTGSAGAARPAGGASAAGFAAPTAPAAPAAAGARAASAGPVAGLEALLALQETGGPLERRRRAVARAGRLLDDLDGVKLALLGQGSERAALEGLGRSVRETRDQVDDPALCGLLDEIETRAAVELAKRERRPAL